MKYFVFLLIFIVCAQCKPINKRTVNLNLETVFSFQKQDHPKSLRFINDLQQFLEKLKKALEKRPNYRRHIGQSEHSKYEFSTFVSDVFDVLKSYSDRDLNYVVQLFDEEIRKYHYRGSKFHELTRDPKARTYIAEQLNKIAHVPVKELRRDIKRAAKILKDKHVHEEYKNLIDLINSVYFEDMTDKFERIVQGLKKYGSKSKRSNFDLKSIIKTGLRDVIFDYYSNLNPNARRTIQSKLSELLNRDIKLSFVDWSWKFPETDRESQRKGAARTIKREPEERKGKKRTKATTMIIEYLKQKTTDSQTNLPQINLDHIIKFFNDITKNNKHEEEPISIEKETKRTKQKQLYSNVDNKDIYEEYVEDETTTNVTPIKKKYKKIDKLEAKKLIGRSNGHKPNKRYFAREHSKQEHTKNHYTVAKDGKLNTLWPEKVTTKIHKNAKRSGLKYIDLANEHYAGGQIDFILEKARKAGQSVIQTKKLHEDNNEEVKNEKETPSKVNKTVEAFSPTHANVNETKDKRKYAEVHEDIEELDRTEPNEILNYWKGSSAQEEHTTKKKKITTSTVMQQEHITKEETQDKQTKFVETTTKSADDVKIEKPLAVTIKINIHTDKSKNNNNNNIILDKKGEVTKKDYVKKELKKVNKPNDNAKVLNEIDKGVTSDDHREINTKDIAAVTKMDDMAKNKDVTSVKVKTTSKLTTEEVLTTSEKNLTTENVIKKSNKGFDIIL